jgi:hypothetical protein
MLPWSTLPARPERPEPLHDLAVARQKVGSCLSETPLWPLRRVAVDAVAGLVEPWEPRLRHRHESNPPKVHHEGAGLAEIGGGFLVERQAATSGSWCIR